jgi:hypothetical protein
MIKAILYVQEQSTGKYFITAEDEEDLQSEIENFELNDVIWDTRYPDIKILKVEKQNVASNV